MHTAEFRRMVDEAKARHNITAVAARRTKLRKAGAREKVGLCLFHSERSPSLRLNDAKGTYHCFGCGASGDIVRFVMETERLGFLDALTWLGAQMPVVSEVDRIRERDEDERERQQAIDDARTFWTAGVDPTNTPAEVYLREVRGISMRLPDSIRFGIVPAWRDRVTNAWSKPMPAVLCAVFNRAGDVVGIQRIFLRADGRAKAALKRPKLTLGRIRGASLRLGPPKASIVVCEGPEDGLSLAQEIPGASVWPTLGTGLMASVEYPDEVREITIAGQNDGPGTAAVCSAASALLERGYDVRTMFPAPGFKDWNDELRGIRS